MNQFNAALFRQYFPLLEFVTNQNDQETVVTYFDNAATTQKPASVINCLEQYYTQRNANVHRASHRLSAKATFDFEQARSTVKNFINARSIKEIIWSKGTTESINLVCQSLARNMLKPKDEIVISLSEHHANIVPWQLVAEQTGAVIKLLTIDEFGAIDTVKLDSIITTKTKIVACAHISNVLARINPVEIIITKAKSVGAFTLIDGAQAVAHVPVDVQAMDCDFYVFSAHKMFGPTGVGVLYGKLALLENMPPYQGGGEMINKVSFVQPTTFNSLPFKFEAGTPNIAGIIAFSQAVSFIKPFIHNDLQGVSLSPSLSKSKVVTYRQHEQALLDYCYQQLAAIPEIKFIVKGKPDIAVLSFTVEKHHNHDVAAALDSYGIAVRSGHHCAMPLMEHLAITGCIRVSLAAYNTMEEIDFFISILQKIFSESLTENSEQDLAVSDKSRTIKESASVVNEVIERFKTAKGWDNRHREIMLLGKRLHRLDKKYRLQENVITGCESLAWLTTARNEQGKFIFSADSDAKVIRGLLYIVLAVFNNKTASQIQAFDIEKYFTQLGLIQHLSPSRGNGLLAIVKKIRKLALVN